jgi:hypothetical protein
LPQAAGNCNFCGKTQRVTVKQRAEAMGISERMIYMARLGGWTDPDAKTWLQRSGVAR